MVTYLFGRGILELLLYEAAAKLVPAELRDVAVDVLQQQDKKPQDAFFQEATYASDPFRRRCMTAVQPEMQ